MKNKFYHQKSVVVYGATGGLGEALCFELYGQVSQLILAGRNPEKLESLYDRLQGFGGACASTLEVWPLASEMELIQCVHSSDVDGLIVATGKTFYQDFLGPSNPAQTWQGYEELLQVNLANVVHLALELLPHFQERGGFCHLAGSYACIFPVPYQAVYSASKAAVFSFVQAVGQEFAADKGLLSISLIGGMATNMYYQSNLHKQFAGFESFVVSPPEKIARSILSGIARKRQIITVGLSGLVLYHFIRRLPSRWLSAALYWIYRPKY